MSVLYTVFGAGWGGGMLTFLLELAHMVVRSINCVLSFSCTQGWYQGYQGWLSHHQKKQVIYSYIFRIKFGHMVKSRVKFSALTAVVLLQRNYRGRSPRREGWGLWRHQWKGQTCQTYPQDPWEIIESLPNKKSSGNVCCCPDMLKHLNLQDLGLNNCKDAGRLEKVSLLSGPVGIEMLSTLIPSRWFKGLYQPKWLWFSFLFG